MATINTVSRRVPSDNIVTHLEWADMLTGDDGAVVEQVEHTDRCIQVEGIFGGGQLVIEGSNNGEQWHALTNPSGEDLIFTSAGIDQVVESPRYLRPRVIGGDGTTSLTVSMIMRRFRF